MVSGQEGEGEGKERGEGVEAKREKGAAAGAEKKTQQIKTFTTTVVGGMCFYEGKRIIVDVISSFSNG